MINCLLSGERRPEQFLRTMAACPVLFEESGTFLNINEPDQLENP
jgi:molybdopterin-guanine dinucleotide biosynthesis protein A